MFSYRNLTAGIICGILSFICYSLEVVLYDAPLFSIGHFFILLAALCAGPQATFLAFTIASLPITLFQDTSMHLLVQAMVVAGALLFHKEVDLKRAPQLITLLAWTLILIPMRFFLTALPIWPESIPDSALSLQCLVDVFLTGAASSIALLPWMHETVLAKPYFPNRAHVIGSASSAALAIAALCGFFLTPASFDLASLNFTVVLTLALVVVFLATLSTEWLERIIETLSPSVNKQKMTGSMIIAEPTSTRQLITSREPSVAPSAIELPSTVVSTPGVCAVTIDGTVIFLNARFRELTALVSEDVDKQNLFDLDMHEDICAQLKETFESISEGDRRTLEIRINELPDTLRFLSLSIEPHVIEEGKTGFLLTVQEITDRRTVESHLLEAQKLKNLGSVVGSIAHAFNNYLTAIIGRASFALRTRDTASQSLALEEIRTHSKKAGELVWKLLEFSEGKPTRFEPLSINAILEKQLDLLSKLVGDSFDITLNIDVEEPWFRGDENLFMQIMTELVTNARDSYREGIGNIEIGVGAEKVDLDIAKLYQGARPGEYLRITVKDTGCGMSNEMVSQAFAPLISTKGRSGSSGLGLAIVYAIVRAHDGFISVESFPEKGTTIAIYLPLANAEAIVEEGVAAAEKTNTEKEHMGENQQILVVEDEPEVRDLIGKMLEMLGYKVETCANADEASKQCESKNFDLIIADYMMPKKNGVDLIRELKDTNKSGTTYLLMSGYGSTSLKHADEDIAVLPKPFDIDTLSESVREALDA